MILQYYNLGIQQPRTPRVILLSLLILFGSCYITYAQTIHLLAYGDDEEFETVDMGLARLTDINRMKEIWGKVAKSMSYQLKVVSNLSAGFSSKSLENDISKLKIIAKDIVVIYYTGHGNDVLNSDYPKWRFKLSKNEHGIEVRRVDSLITKQCKGKNPRNIFIISDCCNKIGTFDIVTKGSQNSLKPLQINGLMNKSRNKKYIICAAKSKYNSFSDTTCQDGDCGSVWSIEFQNQLYGAYEYDSMEKVLNTTNGQVFKNNFIPLNAKTKVERQQPFFRASMLKNRVSFIVADQLESSQKYEDVKLFFIGGEDTTKIHVDKTKSRSEMKFDTLNGTYPYFIEVVYEDAKGKIHKHQSKDGSIQVNDDERFFVVIDQNQKPKLEKISK